MSGGEEIVIARSGKPIARLVPLAEVPRQPGRLKGKLRIGSDFDAPLPGPLRQGFAGEGD